jgi:hypothetical protein
LGEHAANLATPTIDSIHNVNLKNTPGLRRTMLGTSQLLGMFNAEGATLHSWYAPHWDSVSLAQFVIIYYWSYWLLAALCFLELVCY